MYILDDVLERLKALKLKVKKRLEEIPIILRILSTIRAE
jgi:hypothetical protein